MHPDPRPSPEPFTALRSSVPRRGLLRVAAAAAASPWLPGCAAAGSGGPHARARAELARVEAAADGRLGVCAFAAPGGPALLHRADERFPLCSTFKALAAAAVLARSASEPGLLERQVRYGPEDLVNYSPVTERHVGQGMDYAALCAAALQHSDNTAGNLLLRGIGGPAALTAYARALGDGAFRLDRWETALNDAVPGDPRDTGTPQGMAGSLRRLLLDDALPPPLRARLAGWMRGNTTGDARIRAGVPPGWTVADKTGSGDYGTANDIGVAWPASGAPVVIAVYFTQGRQPAPGTPYRSEVIAEATRIAVRALA